MGLMSPCMLPIQMLGIPFAGYVFDRSGSYTVAFRSFIVLYSLAMAITFLLRLPAREVESGDPNGSEGVPVDTS